MIEVTVTCVMNSDSMTLRRMGESFKLTMVFESWEEAGAWARGHNRNWRHLLWHVTCVYLDQDNFTCPVVSEVWAGLGPEFERAYRYHHPRPASAAGPGQPFHAPLVAR